MILLDTDMLIGIAAGKRLHAEARAVLATRPPLCVSAATAWELGLIATQTGRTGTMMGDARRWCAAALRRSTLDVLPVTAEIALEAAYRPGKFHNDFADRWIVATARIEGCALMTSNSAILAYADAGHVRAI